MIAIITIIIIKATLLMVVGLFFVTVSYLALAYIIDTIDDIIFDIHYMLDTHKIKDNIVELLWEVAKVLFCILVILLAVVVLCNSYMVLK